MAFSVYPHGSATGFSEEAQFNSERARLIASLGGRMRSFIAEPFNSGHFDETHSGSNFDVDIAAGDAFVSGHLVRQTATETVTVDPSTTNEIYLVVDDSKTDNASIEYTTGGAPAGQYTVHLWNATTDGSGVTSTSDQRPYVAFPEADVNESVTGLKPTAAGTPNPPSVATDSTGIQSVSVSFDHAYQNNIYSVIASLDDLTDTGVKFGWIRTTNISLTGFDIEVSIDQKGAGGSTADFQWQAQGN